jgi:hypothetical protein
MDTRANILLATAGGVHTITHSMEHYKDITYRSTIPYPKLLGPVCFGIQNFSDFRKVIRGIYRILRNIPNEVWGSTLGYCSETYEYSHSVR